MYPKLKKHVVAFLEKTLEKLYFLFLISWFQKHLCGKNPFGLCIIFEIIVFNLFSLRFKKNKKSDKKHFLFLFSLFLFHFFFQHFFSLSSLLSLSTFSFHLFVHLFVLFSLFFSLFSPLFLLLYLSSTSCFLICFLHRRFCESSLLFLISFFFSSFFFTFFFLHLRIGFLHKQIQTFLWSSFMKTKWRSLIFEHSFLLCFVSCFLHCVVLIPCLFHVLTCFLAFLDISFLDFLVSIFFSGLVQKNVVLLLDKRCKNILLKETLVFLDFPFLL